MELIDNQNRGVLIEGRDNGMGFAFLKRHDAKKYETVQPLSPCKDYLAEVVFTEKHGIPTRAYGLSYDKKLNIFGKFAYMIIRMMPTKGGSYGYGPSLEEDTQKLKDNYPHMERLINSFEKSLGLSSLTIIKPVGKKGDMIVKCSSEWCSSSHSISLYTLLIRVLMVATKNDTDLVKFLETYNYHSGDQSLVEQCLGKIKLILKEGKLPPNTMKYSRASLEKKIQTPHNNGIVAWNSTFTEIPLGE